MKSTVRNTVSVTLDRRRYPSSLTSKPKGYKMIWIIAYLWLVGALMSYIVGFGQECALPGWIGILCAVIWPISIPVVALLEAFNG